jgi:hypothetical protein
MEFIIALTDIPILSASLCRISENTLSMRKDLTDEDDGDGVGNDYTVSKAIIA